ncbi:uncharacterized protein QC764_706650 [Podospora pseudoanserina]|uniref:CCHC-type domain-containing protein n=1 Tax=Podospora pseudoanserina TaxID=2609844 RepID=A0ABR0HJN6_9PEZI|nr:hypothetical protein QC764_706650 [Podospora pseudoanserina]
MPPPKSTQNEYLLPMKEAPAAKTMSSRLMTMKFMQRGAALSAAANNNSPTTPVSAITPTPATPKAAGNDNDNDNDITSSSKRRKYSHAPSFASTAAPQPPLYDQAAIQAAIEEEEKKRIAAVERRAAELGDSHWVLEGVNTGVKKGAKKPLNVVQVGFAQIDYGSSRIAYSGVEDDNPFEEGSAGAAPPLMRFNMKKAEAPKIKSDESSSSDNSDSDSGSVSDDSDFDSSSDEKKTTKNRQQPRGRQQNTNDSASRKRGRSSTLSTKKAEEQKRAQELASQRRKKEVKLNRLSSISGAGGLSSISGGGGLSSPKTSLANMTCHGCGKLGHKNADCPNKRRR